MLANQGNAGRIHGVGSGIQGSHFFERRRFGPLAKNLTKRSWRVGSSLVLDFRSMYEVISSDQAKWSWLSRLIRPACTDGTWRLATSSTQSQPEPTDMSKLSEPR